MNRNECPVTNGAEISSKKGPPFDSLLSDAEFVEAPRLTRFRLPTVRKKAVLAFLLVLSLLLAGVGGTILGLSAPITRDDVGYPTPMFKTSLVDVPQRRPCSAPVTTIKATDNSRSVATIAADVSAAESDELSAIIYKLRGVMPKNVDTWTRAGMSMSLATLNGDDEVRSKGRYEQCSSMRMSKMNAWAVGIKCLVSMSDSSGSLNLGLNEDEHSIQEGFIAIRYLEKGQNDGSGWIQPTVSPYPGAIAANPPPPNGFGSPNPDWLQQALGLGGPYIPPPTRRQSGKKRS